MTPIKVCVCEREGGRGSPGVVQSVIANVTVKLSDNLAVHLNIMFKCKHAICHRNARKGPNKRAQGRLIRYTRAYITMTCLHDRMANYHSHTVRCRVTYTEKRVVSRERERDLTVQTCCPTLLNDYSQLGPCLQIKV